MADERSLAHQPSVIRHHSSRIPPDAAPLPSRRGEEGDHPMRSSARLGSDGLGAALAGADADAVVHREDEDLAVTDLAVGAAATGLDDGVDGRLDEVFVDRDLELDLSEQVHGKLVPAVN